MKDDLVYLRHIVSAIKDIETYTVGGREEFFATKMIQDAVIRNLEIIGEAVKSLSPLFRGEHPDVPWKQIAGLRDVLIHHYFGVDVDSVWLVVESRLPGLLQRLEPLLT
ncbi:MAG: DUF86 domain-containing protein [Pseudomonadota bacterium]|nr:DUF86 domain-containing protein [Pseudomonadota bacterium]